MKGDNLIWQSDLKETKRSFKPFLRILSRRFSRLILIITLLLMTYGAGQFFMMALGDAIDNNFSIGKYSHENQSN